MFTAPWRYLCIICLVLATGQLALAENRSRSLALNSITRGELQGHVDILADDTFEGRESGTRGGHAAAGYLAKHFEKLELRPAGERGSYFQGFGGNARNILALLEGSDPELKHEIVMVGGHYDHVGYGTRRNSYGPWGYIHNGADDNASGMAGLLEVAQALKELPTPPRRSMLLVCWDGEEKGLLGSKHWIASPTVSRERVKCFVNVDMIGRLTKDRVEVYGTRSAVGLRQLLSHANSPGLDLDCTWHMKEDSDHWPFFAQGIPVLMLHTGLHADYHRPSDDAERINQAGLERVTRLLLETACALADADDPGTFRTEARRENNDVRRVLEQPASAPPARLGMTWHKQSSGDALRLRVLTMNRGSAAEQAGLRVGDVVVALQGQSIADDLRFRQQILAAPGEIALTVERTGEAPRSVNVKLNGGPVRVGITTRSDTAEPNIAIVSHVVYGSPAAVAGLLVTDRIEAVDGQSFTTPAEFSRLLAAASDTVTLRVERRGILRDVALELVPQ